MQELGKPPPTAAVEQQLLHHRVAAAGVFPTASGRRFQADRIGVGGFLAIQDLHERGNSGARGIARKSMHCEPRRVSEQLAQGDDGPRSSRARGNLPRGERLIDVRVERQLALLDEMERSHRGDRLADTPGLEQGLGGDRRPTQLDHAESLRPFDSAIVDDGDADALHLIRGHAVLERLTGVRVAQLHDGRGEAHANALDAMLNFGRGHGLCSETSRWGDSRHGDDPHYRGVG